MGFFSRKKPGDDAVEMRTRLVFEGAAGDAESTELASMTPPAALVLVLGRRDRMDEQLRVLQGMLAADESGRKAHFDDWCAQQLAPVRRGQPLSRVPGTEAGW